MPLVKVTLRIDWEARRSARVARSVAVKVSIGRTPV
jgi:hypothetical protein